MYKPPMNTNRVKYMRSKFENNDNDSSTTTTATTTKLNNSIIRSNITINGLLDKKNVSVDQRACTRLKREHTSVDLQKPNNQPLVTRQLSDPLNKCNIKRTPAFRLDKNPIGHKTNKTSLLESKIKIFDQRLNDCDNNRKINEKINCHSKDSNTKLCLNINNSTTIKSPEEKLDDIIQEKENNEEIRYANLKYLYAEPIPKAYRHLTTSKTNGNDFDERKPIDEIVNANINRTERPKLVRAKAIDLSDAEDVDVAPGFTDTLRNALKKPLPSGPAPKKPPRTFLHSPKTDRDATERNSTVNPIRLDDRFANDLNASLQKSIDEKKRSRSRRQDPVYMLNKLENALKQNKIRLKRQETNVSGDESDYEARGDRQKLLLFNNGEEKASNNGGKLFNNLNCLSCSADATYEKINEPKSSFFLNDDDDEDERMDGVKSGGEPVYAIPFHHKDFGESTDSGNSQDSSDNIGTLKRNSLYYMSSPVLSLDMITSSSSSNTITLQDANKKSTSESNLQISATMSSPSTTTITPAATTTPTVRVSQNSMNNNNSNIKNIISAFEAKSNNRRVIIDNDKTDAAWDRDNNNKVKRKRAMIVVDNNNVSSSDHSDRSSLNDENVAAGQSKDDMTTKFETYVRTVRLYADSTRKIDESHLFTCCLLVGLDGEKPYIKSKFPSHVQVPPNTEYLCFPDIYKCRVDDSYKAQCYSLMITKETGERIYGYCRRVLPEGSKNCLPLVYCILSKHRASNFYKRILEEIETHHGLPDKAIERLIDEFYTKPFPLPGQSICIDIADAIRQETRLLAVDDCATINRKDNKEIEDGVEALDLNSFVVVADSKSGYGTLRKANSADGCMKKSNSTPLLGEYNNERLILTLHQDIRYDDTNLEKLCNSLSTPTLQKVFASLLLERKVIFVSCILSQLSSCVEALQSILYPFTWPHTFVPVLPSMLWEIVDAPTPIICGVLCVTVVNKYNIDNALVVDLDAGTVLREVGDEAKILPSCLIKCWKEGMALARSTPEQEIARNILFSDAFLRVFISSCGTYRDFMSKENGFQKEAFIESQKSKGAKRFLKWFTETAMFHSFVDNLLVNENSYPIFDKRIQIYSSQDAATILGKMKDWKK